MAMGSILWFGMASVLASLSYVVGGVKQGCPLSGCLFALAIDPWIRWFKNTILKADGRMISYADDIKMAIRKTGQVLKGIAKGFTTLAECLLLVSCSRKTYFLPLWDVDFSKSKRWISLTMDIFRDVLVTDHLRLLGLWVGPGAGSKSWDKPCEKLCDRTRSIKRSALGIPRTTLLHNLLCSSVLSYVAQFMQPSKQACAVFRWSIQSAIGSAFNAFPDSLLYWLSSAGMKSDLKCLKASCCAAQCRVIQGSQAFDDVLEEREWA